MIHTVCIVFESEFCFYFRFRLVPSGLDAARSVVTGSHRCLMQAGLDKKRMAPELSKRPPGGE